MTDISLKQFAREYPELAHSVIKKRKAKLIFDKHSLDDAAVGQSSAYYQVADAVAKVESLRDEARLTLEELESEVSSKIRRI